MAEEAHEPEFEEQPVETPPVLDDALVNRVNAADLDEKLRLLQEVLTVTTTRDEVVLELIQQSIACCKELGLTALKTARFVRVLHECVNTAMGVELPALEECFAKFKLLMIQESSRLSATEAEPVLTLDDVRAVTEFAAGAFFRFYRAYQFVGAQERPGSNVTTVSVVVETPLAAPALDQGVEVELSNPRYCDKALSLRDVDEGTCRARWSVPKSIGALQELVAERVRAEMEPVVAEMERRRQQRATKLEQLTSS